MPRPHSTTNPDLALVIGATGKTGRRVAQRLRQRGVPTRAVSRSSAISFDWDDHDTWEAAVRGASVAYVTYSPDLAVPAAPPAIARFAELAERRGIERLVLLSGRGEEEAQRCERIVLDANPRSTVVRCSWFAQNFSESFFQEPLRSGLLALPAGDVAEPFVDADDIADVAVAALTETGHEGEIYEITGPRLLTFPDAVQEIAIAAGRDLRFERIPMQAFAEAMQLQGEAEDLIALVRYLFETVLDGRNAYVADGVQRALGRQPRDFSDYARTAAAAGAWAPDGQIAGGAVAAERRGSTAAAAEEATP
ncbi:MAG: NmrA family transcriptional regulator [Acidobacteria bacterium]|nr:MAG: NmrA family transcriptional regulator [Acidobacteriota bacterium]REK09510.1 MAG: NmrA family transcriptional regulator [Acidobacteriota bacterium]